MTNKRFLPFMILFSGLIIFTTSCNKDDDTLKGEIEMTLPDSWEIIEHQNELVLLIGRSPAEDVDDNYLESINVVRENANGYSLESYYQANIDVLGGAINNYQFVSSMDTSINGFDSKRLIYTATISNVNVKNMAYFFHESDKGYVITCSATESSFDEYKPIFESIVSTFLIK